LVVILAVASIAVGLALSILAVFLFHRHAALSVEETKLLSLLPESIPGTCDHFVHPADTDVEGNPLMDGGAVGVLCSAGKGMGWIYLRFELFENEESMNYVFNHLHTPPENRCMSWGPGKAPGVAEALYQSWREDRPHLVFPEQWGPAGDRVDG
jgi:hypothetical protein